MAITRKYFYTEIGNDTVSIINTLYKPEMIDQDCFDLIDMAWKRNRLFFKNHQDRRMDNINEQLCLDEVTVVDFGADVTNDMQIELYIDFVANFNIRPPVYFGDERQWTNWEWAIEVFAEEILDELEDDWLQAVEETLCPDHSWDVDLNR